MPNKGNPVSLNSITGISICHSHAISFYYTCNESGYYTLYAIQITLSIPNKRQLLKIVNRWSIRVYRNRLFDPLYRKPSHKLWPVTGLFTIRSCFTEILPPSSIKVNVINGGGIGFTDFCRSWNITYRRNTFDTSISSFNWNISNYKWEWYNLK